MLLWCISFKIVPFWPNTPTPTVFPLLETFLEFFFPKCVKDALRIYLHVFNRVKSLPFQWKFQVEVRRGYIRGIGRLWKHRNFEFGQKFNDWEGTMGRGIVVVEHPTPVFPQCRPFLPHLFVQTLKDTFVVFLVNCLSCRGKFTTFSFVFEVEGRPDRGSSSNDSRPFLNLLNQTKTFDWLIQLSPKAVFNSS